MGTSMNILGSAMKRATWVYVLQMRHSSIHFVNIVPDGALWGYATIELLHM